MRTLESFVGSRRLLSVVLVSVLFSNSVAQNPPGGAARPSTAGWKIKFDGSGSSPVMSNSVVSEGRVFLTSPTVDYFGSKRIDQGYLCAIDAKTGKLKP